MGIQQLAFFFYILEISWLPTLLTFCLENISCLQTPGLKIQSVMFIVYQIKYIF